MIVSCVVVVHCSVGKFKTLTDRSRQTFAQFRKDRKAILSYNESQVHKYDKYVNYVSFVNMLKVSTNWKDVRDGSKMKITTEADDAL